MKDQAGDGAVRCYIKRGGGADAAGFEKDGPVSGAASQFVISGQGGQGDVGEARLARRCAVAGVIDGPDFDGVIGPVFGEEGGGELGASGVAGEGKDVGLGFCRHRGAGTRGEDFDFRSSGNNSLKSCQVCSVDRIGCGVEDESVGDVGEDKEEKEAVPPYRDVDEAPSTTTLDGGQIGERIRH